MPSFNSELLRRRLSAPVTGLCVLCVFGCAFILTPALNAQENPAGTTGSTAATKSATATKNAVVENRDQLYAEILKEVALLERHGNLLKKVVRLVKPTVVHIEAKKPDDFSRSVEEAGSGVIIKLGEKHYILTNRHVIKDASLQQITIKFHDGREVHPQRAIADATTDVAVMEVGIQNLIQARIGDSAKMEIGDFVIAVGSPFGLSHSVTHGIISAKGRRDLKLGDGGVKLQDFLQTDAAINPGNSGGPLLNLRGEVIGINTAIASSSGGNEGIGFSIPINMAMIVAKQLIANGRVVRAYLGVRMDSRFDEQTARRLGLSRPGGVRVTWITPNSPADRANLQVDDVILRFNNVTIEDDDHLSNLVSLTAVGKQVQVEILRKGKRLKVGVSVSERSRFERN